MKLKILMAVSALPFAAFAGGFQIPQQSIKGTGLGGAYTGICYDAAAIFYNPGGMCNLYGQNFTVAGVGLFPYVSVLTPDNVNTNQTSSVFTPIEIYYSGQVCKNLWAGISINNQFGAAASYPDNWEGQYIVQTIKLQTFMFQPTLAYKICNKLSVGAGFVYTLGTFGGTKAVPLSGATTSRDTTANGEANLNGTGHAFGYNVGVFSNIFEKKADSNSWGESISIGVDYRSGLPFTVPNGTANFSQIPASLVSQFPASQGFSTNVNLPGVLTAGVSVKFSKGNNWDFMLAYDFCYTFWSSYDSLHFSFANPSTPAASYQYGWKNAMAHRMGIEATYLKKYSLRAGYYIDGSPIPDGSVSPEVVDATNSGFSLGASYKFNCGVSVDFAYLRSDFIRNNASWDSEGFTASYHRIVNVFGLGVNYSFNCKCKKSSN
ncbi:MAG TPA: outer membrane protein transport protein [Bacteroidia bacterium]|jgi:long-chain fatty acid transport protein|nr:outer membrane protein transport protein [Bacteroidia bacterium]